MNINVAVIGMGYWGKKLVRNLYEIGVLRVECDLELSRFLIVEEKYPGVEFRQDYQAVLDDDNIQAVVLITPAAMHYEMSKQALDASKDIFVEKPWLWMSPKGRS